MKIKRIVVPFERKAVNDAGEFEGYGSTFGNVDLGDDRIEKGAFTDTLKEWAARKEFPMLAWMHYTSDPIGDYIEMREDEKGLFLKGILWIDGEKRIERAVQAHNLLTGTGPKGLSIGYSVLEWHYEEIDGRKIRVITKIKLWEVSIVGFGMNPDALVTSAKSLLDEDGKLKEKRDFEKALRDGGLSAKQAKTLISGGYNAIVRDEDGQNNDDEEKKLRDEEKAMNAENLKALKEFTTYLKG